MKSRSDWIRELWDEPRDKSNNFKSIFKENLDGDKYKDISYIYFDLTDEYGDGEDLEVVDKHELFSDGYHKLITSVHNAEKFNYHSDTWGDADGYQENNTKIIKQLEPYIGKKVFITFDDGNIYGKLLGIAIDVQYNSPSHTWIVFDEIDDDDSLNSGLKEDTVPSNISNKNPLDRFTKVNVKDSFLKGQTFNIKENNNSSNPVESYTDMRNKKALECYRQYANLKENDPIDKDHLDDYALKLTSCYENYDIDDLKELLHRNTNRSQVLKEDNLNPSLDELVLEIADILSENGVVSSLDIRTKSKNNSSGKYKDINQLSTQEIAEVLKGSGKWKVKLLNSGNSFIAYKI